MAWYTAHAIMFVRFKDGRQDHYPVWENLLLIEAPSDEEAYRQVCDRAKQDEGDYDNTFYWAQRPAEWVFAGLRKLIKVCHRGPEGAITSGDEVSYTEFDVADEASLRKLVAASKVPLVYVY